MKTEQLERELLEQGISVIRATSNKMWPIIRKETDVLVFKAITSSSQLAKGDIVLYKTEEGNIEMSRLHSSEEGRYSLNQDNSIQFVEVDRSHLIGQMVTYYRRGNEQNLDDSAYQTYLYTWVYLWQLRFTLLALPKLVKYTWDYLKLAVKKFFSK